MAVKQGLIGISATNTSPLVSPTRSATSIFGTNPISIAAPGGQGDDRFILDMSTSAVAVGKIEIQLRKHEPLPSAGWALGADGKPTCDPKEAFYHSKGTFNLLGGYTDFKVIRLRYKKYISLNCIYHRPLTAWRTRDKLWLQRLWLGNVCWIDNKHNVWWSCGSQRPQLDNLWQRS